MSKELIERLEAEDADEAGIFTGTARVVPMAVVKPIIEKLEAERDALRLVCAEAYQMAGALNAPTKALDNLSAASTGAPLPHETFLPVEAPQIDREKVRDAIAECLGGSIYCCTRTWSAWGVGTMSQDDFILASEDDGILDELTAAAVSAIEAKRHGGEMNPQAFFDELSAQWKRQRSETQMTLGELIAALEAMPDGAEVANLRDAHSYRGYYSDLAFERGIGIRPVSELLSECKAALGNTFCGYKGGDYVMDAETPVWVAYYGSCGPKLISLGPKGQIEIQEEEQS